MKYIKIISIMLAIGSLSLSAQESFIKGELNIRYDSRQKPGTEGVTDKYALNINVANSAIFRGTIEHLPFIAKTFGANQQSVLNYNLETDIVNPANVSQTRNVGKIYGATPVTENNLYDFTNGGVKLTVFGIGAAKGFESRFSGSAQGKPNRKLSIWDNIKQEAISITNGKGQALSVTKYDKMDLNNLTVVMGPVGIYPEIVFGGSMLYDYNRSAWHFQNLTVTYTENGKRIQDNITGSIRWNKDSYDFDVKVNEPMTSEGAVFAAPADESAFFAVDTNLCALTGTMKYKDTVSQGVVLASNVIIDLKGNQLSKQQTMYLAKLFFLVTIVPFNAE